ncbi:MAG: hypothetical protein Q9168_001612 [Polycauliona sp. 1 TL-2023]
MNWTGGSLSRSRKQNASLSVIQKRHFARARGKLLNARSSPQQIHQPIFHGIETGETIPRRGRQSSQTTLEGFENLRPVVKQLKSLRPRRSPRYDRTELLQTEKPQPPRLTGFRREDGGAIKFTTRGSRTPPMMDELEAKRRDLLATQDWVGLEKMKPVEMKFANPEDRDLIGKRRLVKSNSTSFNPNVSQYRRPLVNDHNKFNMMMRTSRSTTSPGKISIRIGSSRRGSSTGTRRDRSLFGGDDQRVATSDEMLLDDQESFHGFMDASPSSNNALHQSISTSDEMLFGPASSGGAYHKDFRPPTADKSFHTKIPYHDPRSFLDPGRPSITKNVSSGSEPEDTFEAWDLEETPDEHWTRSRQYTESAQRQDPKDSTVTEFSTPERSDLDSLPRVQHRNWPELNRHGHRRSERRVALPSDRKVNDVSQMIRSSSSHLNSPVKECHSAEAKLSDVIEPRGTAASFEDTYGISQQSEQSDTGHNLAIFGSHEDSLEQQDIEEDLEPFHIAHFKHVHKSSTHPSSSPPNQDNAAPIATEAPLSLAPHVEEPKPEPANSIQAPPRRTQEEDELIWRRFVFGTEDPTSDWTFEDAEEEAITHPPILSKPKKTTNPSSPLETTTANAANDSIPNSDNPHTHSHTQNSLIVEASSSPPSTPDLNNDQGMHTNISQSQSSSSSDDPPMTQHSIQAQAPTSPLQASDTSPDPLSHHPSGRIHHPTVTFRKPSRYVGESQESVTPVRLGMGRGKRNRRAVNREDDDDADDATYGESGERRRKKRKKGRRDWAGSEVEDIDGGEADMDEIID